MECLWFWQMANLASTSHLDFIIKLHRTILIFYEQGLSFSFWKLRAIFLHAGNYPHPFIVLVVFLHGSKVQSFKMKTWCKMNSLIIGFQTSVYYVCLIYFMFFFIRVCYYLLFLVLRTYETFLLVYDWLWLLCLNCFIWYNVNGTYCVLWVLYNIIWMYPQLLSNNRNLCGNSGVSIIALPG